jgi:hypothetical protein
MSREVSLYGQRLSSEQVINHRHLVVVPWVEEAQRPYSFHLRLRASMPYRAVIRGPVNTIHRWAVLTPVGRASNSSPCSLNPPHEGAGRWATGRRTWLLFHFAPQVAKQLLTILGQ